MSVSTIDKNMLYCPKCKTKYEDGSQRFCNNDGGRLLPYTVTERKSKKDAGVFTNLLGRTAPSNERDEKLAKTPRFVKAKNVEPKFQTPNKSKVFKSEQQLKPRLSKPAVKKEEVKKTTPKSPRPKSKPKPKLEPKPLSKLINPNEVKIDRAKLGDRRVNPTGRTALSWDNPKILLGQTVKGRYYITEQLDKDHASIAYLADDKIIHSKKAIVRVLMEENSKESLEDKIFAEERVSLSHINHPNIARVIDSGELPEGKPFIVTDYLEGRSVKEILDTNKELNPMRVARIVRQASYALSEVHQNGILHRSLKPDHILLTVSEAGMEQVKVTDFCVSSGRDTKAEFNYKSPEQVGGQLPTFASDTYSLAVIAYEMLTGQLPFKASNPKALLKAQKSGLTTKIADIKQDLPPLVDDVIDKALSFNPSDRYPKARDFGEALYNSLMTASPWEDKSEAKKEEKADIEADEEVNKIALPSNPLAEKADISIEHNEDTSDIHIASTEEISTEEEVNEVVLDVKEEELEKSDTVKSPASDSLWEKRSPEPAREGNWILTIASILGLILLVIGVIGIWQYFSNRGEQPLVTSTQNQTENLKEKDPTIRNADENKAVANQADNIEVPPPEREITEPPNSKYFENSKQNLSKELAKNYRGFSVYYPETWKSKKSDTNFLDVVKEDENGLPKEQMIVTYYESMGTFDLDKKKFPDLVSKSNKDLQTAIPNYEVVSQGNITVNNGWKSYEVKFKGKAPKVNGEENVEIWGRRIWMPAARPGVKNGFVITMLATSLSDKIESLDDVGKKGDLGDILYTFEPDRNY